MGEARNFLGAQAPAPVQNNRNLFIGNVSGLLPYEQNMLTSFDQLPLQASWQDLKDLMRQAGEVIRADIGMMMDGRPKGNGTVVFVTPEDARTAIGE